MLSSRSWVFKDTCSWGDPTKSSLRLTKVFFVSPQLRWRFWSIFEGQQIDQKTLGLDEKTKRRGGVLQKHPSRENKWSSARFFSSRIWCLLYILLKKFMKILSLQLMSYEVRNFDFRTIHFFCDHVSDLLNSGKLHKAAAAKTVISPMQDYHFACRQICGLRWWSRLHLVGAREIDQTWG